MNSNIDVVDTGRGAREGGWRSGSTEEQDSKHELGGSQGKSKCQIKDVQECQIRRWC